MGLFDKLFSKKSEETQIQNRALFEELFNNSIETFKQFQIAKAREDVNGMIEYGEKYIQQYNDLTTTYKNDYISTIKKQSENNHSYYFHSDLGIFFKNGLNINLEDHTKNIERTINIAKNAKEKAEMFNDYVKQIPVVNIDISKENILERKSLEDMPEIKISPIGKNFNKQAKLSSYVVIHAETTGLKAERDRIVKLSAIKVIDREIVSAFNTLINPEKHIDKKASEVNGIFDNDVKDAPLLDQVAQSFIDYIGNNAIIGYNISFTLSFLYTSGVNLLDKRKIYDCMTLVRKAYSEDIKEYSLNTDLGTMTVFNKIYYYNHEYINDCVAIHKLFEKAINDYVN